MEVSLETTTSPRYTLAQLVGYSLMLGSIGFGGPVALVGYMHRDLVEKRGWISESEYKEGLAIAQLAPGPLAAQLAIYLGFVHYGVLGATLVGITFVLPSFLMVVALGWAYQLYGGISWMQAVFYGVGASVIGILTMSAWKLTSRTIRRDVLLGCIYLTAAVITVVTEQEHVAVFLGAGILVWLVRERLPSRQVPAIAAVPVGIVAAGSQNVLWTILLFFTKAGAFVFGSGLAIVPFLYGGVVNEYHWLTEQQFLDAVAVAMITPGPVVICAAFIGYLVAGLAGATVASFATFLPCYLITVILAPYFRKHGKKPAIAAFVSGVTAAAIGTIAGAVIILGRRSLVDVPTALLAISTAIILWRTRRIPEPVLVILAALVGLAVKFGLASP